MNISTVKQCTGIVSSSLEGPSAIASRFKRVQPFVALVILIGTAVLIGYGLLRGQEALSVRGDKSGKDVHLYQAIVKRLHSGESYYVVAGEELRARGYATRPFVNWRPPFLAWFLAALPNPTWGRLILLSIASMAWAMWVILFYKAGDHRRTIAVAMLLSVFFPTAYLEVSSYFHEFWAGMIILFTLALYANNHWRLAVLTGSAALLLREISLPFVLVMLGCAVWERRWSEVVCWVFGLTAFALFLIIHASIVTPLLSEADRTNVWVRWGGWRFVLATAGWNPWLILFDFKWIVAVMFPLALVGLAGWRGRLGYRVALTVIAYILVFMLVGRQDNAYWGMLYAPLVTFGWMMAPAAFYDLWTAARRIRHPQLLTD